MKYLKYLLSFCGSVALLLAGTTQAPAALTTFDLTSSPAAPWTTGDLTFSSGGLTVSAGAFDGGTRSAVATRRIHIGSNAAGLVACAWDPNFGSPSVGCFNDEHTVDSTDGPDEDIKFTFSQEVTLKSVSFTFWDGTNNDIDLDDDFSLFVGTTPIFTDRSIWGDGTVTYDFSTLSDDLTDTMFFIGARGTGDEFKIHSLTVEAVPAPSSMLLLGTGLAGLVGISRRTRNKK